MNNMIGEIKESSLHASLKLFYARPGDKLESIINNYHIDIVKDTELLEIQTGNFSSIKTKLQNLLPGYVVRLIYPLVIERWIVRLNLDQSFISRRKSPRKGNILDIFNELVFISKFLPDPNLIFEVVFVKDELHYINDEKGSWRRKGWSKSGRKLLGILGTEVFHQPSDFLRLLPEGLHLPFTVQQMAETCHVRKRLASRMAYCLFHMGTTDRIGKQGRAWVYQLRALTYNDSIDL